MAADRDLWEVCTVPVVVLERSDMTDAAATDTAESDYPTGWTEIAKFAAAAAAAVASVAATAPVDWHTLQKDCKQQVEPAAAKAVDSPNSAVASAVVAEDSVVAVVTTAVAVVAADPAAADHASAPAIAPASAVAWVPPAIAALVVAVAEAA